MTQPLTSFWPIFATKSDGHDVVNVKGRVIRNGPTQEQLDRTPNEQGQCDYYRLIEKEDPKHIDWRKKLGGMLLREIGGKQHEEKWQQTILWDFPENYQLYEHIKTKADGQTKTVKNHSGGGHDRQDAYLYGYPKGPRKRYRSPADFFPHLLWLCTDEKSDYQNCTCKMCSPVQLDVPKPPVKAEVKNEPVVVVKEEPAKPAAVQAPSAASHTVAMPAAAPARRSISGPPTQSPIAKPATPVAAPTQAPIQPQIRAPAIQQSTPLPQPRGAEQLTDGRYGLFICRVGEVVWFFRPKTSAWGLGLVLRRWVTKDNTNSKSYLVQPLSHPYDSPAPEVVTADEHLKPWLAWSAPACTFAYLQQNPQLRYDQVDWNALLTGQYGQGIADVDASILAAKAIDITYTLSERVKTSPSPTGEDRHYNCVFMGAEKIWRGDPVRIRVGPGGVDLMVVMDIVERVSAQKQATSQSHSQVWILGDIYSYSTIPVSDPSNLPPNPQDANSNLPLRMREDMSWRNRALIPQAQTLAYWKLIQAGARVEIADIKGRWYETSLLFQESFLKAVKANEGGNGIWMNARGDAAGIGRAAGVVVGDRVMAFGNAVPKGTQLVEGIDAPNQSRQAGAEMHDIDMSGGMHGGTGTDGFSLDDFMNVEHMDDANVDFGNNFNF